MLKDRDIRQRIVGFVSFSFLTHCGLIALAFLAPNMIREMGASSKQSETYLVDSAAQASAPVASLGEAAQAEPQLVQRAPEPKVEEGKQEASKEEAVVEAKPEPKAVTKKLPTTAKAKVEAATKKVLALPTKKSATSKAVHKVQTVDQSDLAVKQELAKSRATEDTAQEESKPEVAADIQVQADKQEETPQALADAEVAAEKTDAEAVQSGTTADSQESKAEEPKQEEKKEVAPVAAAVSTAKPSALPSKSSSATSSAAPLIAPIQKGAQVSRPATQVGGLTNPAATQGSPEGQAAATNAASIAGSGGAGVAAGGIRDADSLMEQAGNAKPVYPVDDQRAGRQGTVIFDAMVTKDGSVQGIQLKQSSGFATLDSSAYEAFKKHHYLAGQEGMVRKKFQFVLNGEKTEQARLRRR